MSTLGGPLLAQGPWSKLWEFGRAGHVMAYDPVRNRTVLFGGTDAAGQPLRETWEFDGTRWQLLVPAVRPPSEWCSLAFDIRRRVAVLLTGPYRATETWEWDGTNWTQRPTPVRPDEVSSLAYDERRGVTVAAIPDYTMWPVHTLEAWEWDGSAWRKQLAANPPEWRVGFRSCYYPPLQRVLLHGGRTPASGGGFYPGEMLTWDGTTWTLLPMGIQRSDHALAYDRRRGRLVSFCGFDGSESDPELLEWDGASPTWRLTRPSIPGRRGSAMVFDAARGRCLIVGGDHGGSDVFEWDGATLHDGMTAGPGGRTGCSAFHDPARDRLIVFGGTRLYDRMPRGVWEWDGSTWQRHDPAVAPAPRRLHGAAFDEARGRALLFGGEDLFAREDTGGRRNDLWEWDGTAWTARPAAAAPAPRSGAALTFDSTRGRLVLFGGETSAGRSDETWEWDRTVWRQHTVPIRPSPRAQAAVAHDRARNRVVLYGGFDGQSWLGDCWEWDGSAWQQRESGSGFRAWPQPALVEDLGRACVTLVTGAFYPAPDLRHRVYEWRGAGWEEQWAESLNARHQPTVNGFAVAYDRLRGRLLRYGGGGGAFECDQLWAFTVSDLAAREEFAAGCWTSALQRLGLTASRPLLGATWSLQAQPVPPGRSAAILWLGTSRTGVLGQIALPIALDPLGMAGCALLVSPDLTVPGSPTWNLPLCNCPELNGVSLFLQAALVDPGANPTGVAWSAGLAARLGLR